MTRLRRVIALGALALVASLVSVSTLGPLTINGYIKVSEKRVTRNVSEFTYRATLTNGGPALAGATATATSLVPATVIVDGSLTFGPVGPGGKVVSTDTFKFRHDRRTAFNFANIVWTVSGSPANVAPVANAGPDQAAILGNTVTLNGSASSDANGDPLTFAWTLTSRPAGSAAALSSPTAVMPTFVVDRPGTYEISLTVNDGLVSSAPDTVVVSTLNTPPVANAGPDQAAALGNTVTLNGSASSDADGNPLTFAWSVVSRPAGSAAVPTPATAVMPTFVVDRAGTYVFSLMVNDGTVDSAPDTVIVSTLNTPPVANAGPDQGAALGATVTLNGSASSDADGNPLTFAWSFVSKPAGSAATLSNPTAVMPTFFVDLPGDYVVQLKVNDGTVDSAPDTVSISTSNSPPVANAGPDQSVVAGGLVALNGSLSSDPDGDALTFAWSLTTVPAGSTAVLVGATSVTPSFVADKPGTYVAQLTVNDGIVDSVPDTVTISTTNVAPVANAGPDQLGRAIGVLVTLDGSLSSDADGHALTYAWAFSTKPAGSLSTIGGATSVAPTFTPDLAGDYVIQLQVSDGFVTSPIDTVLIRVNAPPVANAGPDQSVTVATLATLDGSGSSDPEGQPLTYAWVLTGKPAGSGTTLAGPSTVAPTLTPDIAGPYTVQLTVTDDRGATATDTVVITAVALPVVSIAATDPTASETGPDPGRFVVTRTGSVAAGLTVHYAFSGSAGNGVDFATLLGSVLIGAGQLSANIDLFPINDLDIEGSENVVLTLVPDAAYALGAPTSATVTIADNDLPAVSVVATDGSATEAAGDTGLWTLTRTGPTTAPLTVNLTYSGSATIVTDYANPGSTALFGVGQATTTVTLTPVLDADPEATEVATMTVAAGAGYVVGAPASANINITDSTPRVTVVATDGTAAETGGDSGLWTLTRTGSTAATLGVNLSYGGSATLSVDYSHPGSTALFGVGQSTITVALTAVADALIESPETATLTIGPGTNYVVGAPASADIVITDTTPTVTVVATDGTAAETGGDSGLWTLTRTGSTAGTLGVNLSYSGSATLSVDYSHPGSTVLFAVGQSTATVALTAVADAIIESPETATLTIGPGTNYVVGAPASADVIITDTTPTVTVVATDGTAAETGGDSGLWTLTRTGSTAGTLGVNLSYSGSAALSVDYSHPGSTAFFGVGQSTTTVTLTAVADALIESLETATLTIGPGTNYVVGAPASGNIVITDTTPTVTVVATDNVSVEAGGNTGLWTLTRTGSTAGTLGVNLSYSGSATLSVDYSHPGSTALFGVGQSTTTVTLNPVNDGVPESDETATLTIGAGTNYFVGSPSSANITIADATLTPMSIGLVGTSVVGVGRTATMRVTLSAPAGAGGVPVTFTSANTSFLTITGSPVTVPAGATTADVTLHGVAVTGGVTVTATATGYVTATAGVPVTLNLISTPPTLNVALGGTTDLPITIGPSPAPPGGITVNVTSANASIIQVLTPTVTIVEGQLSANATVLGAGTGSATVTASHALYSPSSTTVSATGNLNIIDTSVTFNNGFTPPNITVRLETGAGIPTPAPSNLIVTLTSANTACVAVPATVTIPAGQVSVQFQPNYGGTATLPCTAIVTASLAGLTSDSGVSVTVNPQPGISDPGTATVGAWLQVAAGVNLGTGGHGGVTATITSDDPTRVRVAPDGTTAGTTSFTINVPNGSTTLNYWIQGIEGTTGTAHITISAPGFVSRVQTVNVVTSGIELIGLATTLTTLSANDSVMYAQVGIPNAAGTALQTVQNVRGGATYVFTLTNSTAAVGQLYSDEPVLTGQVVTKRIRSNIYYNQAVLGGTSYGLAFDPLAAGTTTVTVTGPAGVATMSTNGVRSVTVTGPGITMPATQNVGAGLQLNTGGANLGATAHGGVTATVTSSDPTRVLVSPNGTTAGTASITVTVANGFANIPYYVQGVENTTGSATITVTPTGGFPSGTQTVNVVPIGIEVHGLPTTTTTLSANDISIYAQVGIPNPAGTQLQSVQNVRAGGPAFVFTLTNSNSAVGQLYSDQPVLTGQVVTKPIQPNIYYNQAAIAGTSYGLAFDPLGGGTTVVTVSGPAGVVTMTSTGVRTVTVTSPSMTMPGTQTVGAWLQSNTGGANLGASAHGGVTATITSSDPSRVRVSPNGTTAGTASFTVAIPNGSTNIAYFVQGMEGTTGSATITVSTGGVFPAGTQTVNVVPIGIEVHGLPTSTTTLSANDTSIYAQVGIPNGPGTGLATVQSIRAGGPLFVFTLTNSNATVGQLYSDEPVVTGQVVTKPIRSNIYYNQAVLAGTTYGLAFDPLSAGSTTVTVTGPAGVATMTTNGVRTIGVSAPGITVTSAVTVGAGLQLAINATLGGSAHGGITATVSSSSTGIVRVSPNATTAGTGSIGVPVANGATNVPFYVQGLENVTGTAVVTISAPGFISATVTVTVVPSALEVLGLPTSIAAGAANDINWYAQVGIPNGVNTALAQVQNVRAGGPAFIVTLTNSNATVARLYSNEPVTTGQVVTKPINPGIYYTASAPGPAGTSYGLAFDPLAAGTTNVTVTGPTGVLTMTTNGIRTITVTP